MREKPRRRPEDCAELLDRFLLPFVDLPDAVRRALASPRDTTDRDLAERLGRCLWDIFSSNHEVVDPNGHVYDLGSFRAAARFIASRVETRYPELGRFGYLDFYLGTLGPERPPEVYTWIFECLRAVGCDWVYTFPRLYVVRIGEPEKNETSFLDYDPSKSFENELQAREKEREFEELTRSLDEAHEESVRKARNRPLPVTVAAYREVFGHLPEGWPHPDM